MKKYLIIIMSLIFPFYALCDKNDLQTIYEKYRQELLGSKLIKNDLMNDEDKKTSEFYYFISFSMRDEAIYKIMEEAQQYDIPVYINGLINNSLKETTAKFLELFGQNSSQGLAIDPNLFREFAIKGVPALVVKCNDVFDKVSGNIPLNQALEKIMIDGDCKDLVASKLGK